VLSRAEMRVVSRDAKLSGKVACVECSEMLGLEDIVAVLQRTRLRLYGQMSLKEDTEWVKNSTDYMVREVDQREHGRK